MPKQGQFLPIMIQAFPTLRLIARLPNPLQNFLQVILNIVLDNIDLDDVLPEVVVLDIRNLRVLVPLLCQVEQMVRLHLLDYLHQPVVESGSYVHLVLVLLLQRSETVDVLGVLTDTRIAQTQDLHYLLVNRLVLVLRVVGKLVTLAHSQTSSLKPDHLTATSSQLGSATTAIILLLLFSSCELSALVWVVQTATLRDAVGGTVAEWIGREAGLPWTDQRFRSQCLAVSVCKLWYVFLTANQFSCPRG